MRAVSLSSEPALSVLKNELVQLHKSQNATILFTSHILSDIEQLCNRVGVLDHGALLFEGDLDELKGKKQTIEDAVLNVMDNKNIA